MARINFDDSVESHDQFWRLLPMAGGDRDRALGMLLRFFRLAQQHYGRGVPMSEETLHEQGLSAMIKSGWAVPIEGGFHALGAKKHFDWYQQRVEAGRSRAAGTRNAMGQFTSGAEAESSEPPAEVQREPATHQPLALSLALSPALSQNKENTRILATQEAAASPAAAVGGVVKSPRGKKFNPETAAKMRAFIATYAEGYKTKYGGPPEGIRDKGLIGKLGHWIETVSEEKATQLAQVYMQIDYRPINESCHDLWLFFRNLNRIGNALSSGQDPGGIDWGKVFGRAS